MTHRTADLDQQNIFWFLKNVIQWVLYTALPCMVPSSAIIFFVFCASASIAVGVLGRLSTCRFSTRTTSNNATTKKATQPAELEAQADCPNVLPGIATVLLLGHAGYLAPCQNFHGTFQDFGDWQYYPFATDSLKVRKFKNISRTTAVLLHQPFFGAVERNKWNIRIWQASRTGQNCFAAQCLFDGRIW